MAKAEPKTLAAVTSFIERQKLEYNSVDEAYCAKMEVRSGARRASVSVYNTGKIVVGGPDSPLRVLLEQMKEAIEAGEAGPGQALPFEIDRLPDTIRERVPECDPVIIRFVDEAIRCFRSDALLAAAFMIGAASERAVNLLIHTYAESIGDETNRNKLLGRINNRMISKKYEEFLASYKGCKSRPADDPVLSQDLDVVIGGMFQFCRITRNEVGHPQIVPDLDRGVLLANLGHLATYMGRIYALMKHFREKGVEV
jgi:hypothetical protein